MGATGKDRTMRGLGESRAVGVGRARAAIAFMLAALIAGPAIAVEAGLLETMRREVRGAEVDPDSPGNPNNPGNHGNPDKPDNPDTPSGVDDYIIVESGIGEAVGMMILEGVAVVLSTPFVIPRAAMGDDDWRRGLFTEYPYSDGPGYLSIPGSADDGSPVVGHRNLACTAGLAYAKDDAVETFRGDFQLRTAARAGLRVAYTSLSEDLGGGTTDTLSVSDAAVLVRFAQHEKAQMRFGIGYVSMPDADEDGAIFVYEGDFFPNEPVIVSAGVDVGGLGDATYSRWHLGVGVARRNLELSLGYSSLRVGSVELRGPTVGSRVWF